MAIIDMFKMEKKSAPSEEVFLTEVGFAEEERAAPPSFKDKLCSFLCVRLFFLVLLACTVVWFTYVLCKTFFYLLLQLCFWKSSPMINAKLIKAWLSVKRAFICSIALLLGCINPSLGIMIACAYFLMFDKSGVEEVVPASLREQFKDLFAQGDAN
jgi:hypothetical protein